MSSLEEGMVMADFMCRYGGPIFYEPKKDLGELIPMPILDWWEQVVVINNSIRMTRKMIVLNAANKDGGAHVDARLPEGYDLLVNGVWKAVKSETGQLVGQIAGQNLACLRQICFEFLESADIKQLSEEYTNHVTQPSSN